MRKIVEGVILSINIGTPFILQMYNLMSKDTKNLDFLTWHSLIWNVIYKYIGLYTYFNFRPSC